MPKPLIILLPGTDGTGVLFDDLSKALTDFAEVWTIAYPQTGPQTYDALGEALLPRLPVDRDYILVGESFGGPLAVWLAVHALRQPVKLILGATFAASPFGRMGRWARPLLWIGERLPLWTWQIDTMLFNGRNRSMAQNIQDAVRFIPRQTLMNRVRTVLDCDVTGLLEHLDMPVLCLNARRDRLIPPWLPRHFSKRPNVQIRNLDLPHMIFQSDAKTVTHEHILPFLKACHASPSFCRTSKPITI